MPRIRDQVRAAEQHLAAVDPVMAEVIARHGPCTLGARARDPFHTLCSSIISQQLSSKAADTIQARLMAGIGAATAITPLLLAAATHEQLRTCGLSNAKAKWLKALGEAADAGTLDFGALARLDDEAAIELLDALPGIGRQFVLAITNRDYTAIMGITIFYAAALMVMILIVDLLYAVLDPRIKLTDAPA